MDGVFDLTTFSTEASTRRFLTVTKELWQQSVVARAGPFHHYIDELARRRRPVRQYTQNVDWTSCGVTGVVGLPPLPPKCSKAQVLPCVFTVSTIMPIALAEANGRGVSG